MALTYTQTTTYKDLACANTATIDEGDIVYLDTYTDSTTDVNESVTGITAGDTSFDVDDASVFSVYDVIRIDSEKMKITGISTNTLTVQRAYLGTTAATHADNTQVDLVDAIGYVMYNDPNVRFIVAVLAGTFASGTIKNQDNDSATISSVAATTGTKNPAAVSIVTGTDTSVTDFFRDLCDNVATGFTDPGSGSQMIVFDMWICVGRRDNINVTEVTSYKENIDLDGFSSLRLHGNTSFKSKLTLGKAKYFGDTISSFPPVTTRNGTTIKGDNGYWIYAGPYTSGTSVITDTNSIIELYDSKLLNCTFNIFGTFYSSELDILDNIYNYCTFNLGSIWYTNNTRILGDGASSAASGFLIVTSPQNFLKTKMFGIDTISNIFGIYFYAAGQTIELDLYNCDCFLTDGQQDKNPWLGNLFMAASMHFVNTSSDFTSIAPSFAALEILAEASLDVMVMDENKNPIPGAKVDIFNNLGQCNFVFYGYTAANQTAAATVLKVANGNNYAIGDILRIGQEQELVTSINTGVTPNELSVTRNYSGSTKTAHAFGTKGRIYKLTPILTRNDGKIDTYNLLYFCNISTAYLIQFTPFTIKVSKSGYKTYKSKFDVGRQLQTGKPMGLLSAITYPSGYNPYDTTGIKLNITLKKNRFREEKSQ